MHSISQLIQDIASLFKKNNWQIVTAESCTGGLIASYLTELPGSSSWFERGFVTYSNLSKEEMLSVPRKLIDDFGAVSEPVAAAMAQGALQKSAAQVALSVTGIAGPDGGTIEKPVGTVCFGWAVKNMGSTKTLKKQFSGSRQDIRLAASYEALSGLLALIKTLA